MFSGNDNYDCIRGTNDYCRTDSLKLSDMNPNSIPESTNNHHEASSVSRSDNNTAWRQVGQDLDRKLDSHLPMNKWNPVAGEHNVVTQAEQNIEYKDTESNEIWRNFKQQRIDYSTNAHGEDQNEKGDILSNYSIRELDPEWCNSQDKNGLQCSLVVPNNNIDKTHVFENNKIGVFNTISDRNLCITDKNLNSSENQHLNFINNTVEQNDVRKKTSDYAQAVPRDSEYIEINKFEKHFQPMLDSKRFKPVSAISDLRIDNNSLEFSNSLHTQLERTNNHETKPKKEVNSAPKNSVLNISHQIIPCAKSTNIDSSSTPNVVGVRNVQSLDGFDGNLLGASSHIINFKNNVCNVPPPPISPP